MNIPEFEKIAPHLAHAPTATTLQHAVQELEENNFR